MIKKRPKFQRVSVVVPAGYVAGIIKDIKLDNPDKDYPFITGVAAKVTSLGGCAYVDLSVKDANGPVIDPCFSDILETDKSVAADHKFTDILIKNDGRIIYAGVTPPTVPATDVTVQFVFRLEDTMEEIPNIN